MPAFTALLGDHVHVSVGAGESVPYIKDGTVRILANLSEKRVKAWPNVPTLRELGYDIFNESVFMFSAPKGTPQYIIEKLQNAFRKVMDDPEFAAMMTKVEFDASYRNAADTKKYLDDANKRIGHMVQELKLPKRGLSRTNEYGQSNQHLLVMYLRYCLRGLIPSRPRQTQHSRQRVHALRRRCPSWYAFHCLFSAGNGAGRSQQMPSPCSAECSGPE